MVVGLDTFKIYFADHGDYHVLIGGAACDLAGSARGLSNKTGRKFAPRATSGPRPLPGARSARFQSVRA